MQDRYAGDVGDFMKLALLEHLCAPDDPSEPGAELSVGIVWYLVEDETHNNDGKYVDYLDPAGAAGRALRPVSPRVYDSLRNMVDSGPRSVERLVASGALPVGCVSHAERLALRDLPPHDRVARRSRRSAWLAGAVRAIERCDLVCLDPDNGIRADDHPVGSHRNGSEKHSYLHEIAALAGADRSVLAYQHADRSGPLVEQAERRMGELADALGRAPIAAVRTSRGTARLFIVVPAARHEVRLRRRVAALESGTSGAEFDVIRWAGARH